MRISSTRLLFVVLGVASLSLSAGCAVPQPRGEGQYKRVKEPRTGAYYHLYLPVDYVKNDGKHPNSPETRKWPLVMTFHGMKPYDNARPQEREWEKEADIYGYVVCAPELKTSDSFMEYPLTKEWGYVRTDRENVIAIMDHVFATTMADPQHVLSTSWSCGGYLAHYFPNRFPHRFSCIATRLSNFSAELLKEETVPEYKDRTSVGIFIGDGDLPACKAESEQAVAWYEARNFKVVEGKMIDSMGHRRIPQTAAAFFARQLGIKPLHPADAAKSISKVQMTTYTPSPQLLASMSPRGSVATGTRIAAADAAPAERPNRTTNRTQPRVRNDKLASRTPRSRTVPPPTRTTPDRSTPTAASSTRIASASPSSGNWLEPVRRPNTAVASRGTTGAPSTLQYPVGTPQPIRTNSTPPPATGTASPARSTYRPTAAEPRRYEDPLVDRLAAARRGNASSSRSRQPVATSGRSTRPPVTPPPSRAQNVDISIKGPTIGTAPYYLAYGIELPSDVTGGADFLWKDNGVWMGDQPYGVKILETPGVHRITVLMITRDNVEYRGMTTVRVLDRAASADLSDRRR
ncbi:MAG: hypothetical protein H6819_03320 [Phycisphaerales bacterium]|nr:hypothetical protein [Phycisphaerales bacterium]MCB9856226.1 hypothetical protein [Phycisphaerales bacterium]MCB9863335.1 hypothetical protein [Phycisphaerales bacterium]